MKMSVNIARKSCSTWMQEYAKESVQDVCDTMAHSEKTQREHYWPREREKAVLEGTTALSGYFFGGASSTISSPNVRVCVI